MTRFNAKHPAKVALLLLTALSAAVAATALPSRFALAQDPEPKNDLGNEVAPPPPSIGADIPLTYFGPAPSTVQKELIGPYQLLRAGTVNDADLTVTLPLYKGKLASGEAVWFILTDTNDKANADALGLNFSGKLGYADVGKAVRPARQEKDGSITFERGKVNFAPELVIVPGDAPNYFPPKKTEAGSVGDANYSPLTPDLDRHFLTVGVGRKGQRIDFDITYQLGLVVTHTVTGSIPSTAGNFSGQTADGTYDFISHAIFVSVGLRF